MDIILRSNERYPEGLRGIKPEVKQLYCLGDFQRGIFEKCVAIVGSRRMTNYGEQVIERIVPTLVEAGVTIVSGFMYGVDQKAHQVCVECGGKTVVVLAWGVDYKYDTYIKSGLQGGVGYQKIIDNGGLVVSEWLKEKPQYWMFAYRNRIVAGLVQAVVIVEAAEKSGSLITAKWAGKLGKQLLAVPGQVTSSVAEGTNQLINEGRAKMVTSGSEVFAALNLQAPNTNFHPKGTSHFVAAQTNLNDRNSNVLNLLQREALRVDEIAKKLKQPVETVMEELSLLQLQGKIEEKEGRFYRL